jgi:hypothetical protein
MFSVRNRIGFVVALMLGLTDLPSVLDPTPQGQVGPPMVVLVLSSVCGLTTVGAVSYGWVRHSWFAIRAGAGARIVSMLLAMPAFFVEGLPPLLRATVAFYVLITIATVFLMLSPVPRAPTVGEPR